MSTAATNVQSQSGAETSISWWRKLLSSEGFVAWLFILPSLVGFAIFYAYPALRGMYISLTDWDLLTEPNFVGFGNYVELFQDEDFWNALWVTVKYVLFNIPLQTALAIVVAVMMDRLTKSILVRGTLILPWLLPNVVVGLLFLWLLDTRIGIVNQGIQALGFSSIPFLGSVEFALPSIAGINIWRHLGYTALLIFAGLQTIPKSIYEAASIDGADEIRSFWHITLPLLRPVLVFVVVTSLIGSFQIFDTVAVTTQGGPVNATEVMNWFIFEHAFERFNMGYATTASMVLFLILVFISIAQLRIFNAGEVD